MLFSMNIKIQKKEEVETKVSTSSFLML